MTIQNMISNVSVKILRKQGPIEAPKAFNKSDGGDNVDMDMDMDVSDATQSAGEKYNYTQDIIQAGGNYILERLLMMPQQQGKKKESFHFCPLSLHKTDN